MLHRHIILAAMAAGLAGCPGLFQGQTDYGEAVEFGDGTIQSFLTTDRDGAPVAFGVIWDGSFNSLPPAGHGHPADDLRVPLPEGVQDLFPVDHITMDWLPHGHDPIGVFDRPHLDLHFYLISVAERLEIEPGDCQGTPLTCEALARARMLPPAHATPPGYSSVDAIVPFMGNHLVDLTAPEFTGGAFTNSWLWGSWDGKIAFLEPMISRAYLEGLDGEDCRDFPTPSTFAVAGWYPSSWCVSYSQRDRSYVVSLEGFARYPSTPALP